MVRGEILERLELIRLHGGRSHGLSADVEEAAGRQHTPKIAPGLLRRPTTSRPAASPSVPPKSDLNVRADVPSPKLTKPP